MNWEMVIAIVGILEFIASIVMGIGLYLVSQKAARIDRLEEHVTAKAEELIQTRFELLAVEFKGMLDQVKTVVEGLKERLGRGDAAFDSQDEKQQRMELQLERREAALKEWAMKEFGSKAELAALGQSVHQAEIMLTRFEQHLSLRGGGD